MILVHGGVMVLIPRAALTSEVLALQWKYSTFVAITCGSTERSCAHQYASYSCGLLQRTGDNMGLMRGGAGRGGARRCGSRRCGTKRDDIVQPIFTKWKYSTFVASTYMRRIHTDCCNARVATEAQLRNLSQWEPVWGQSGTIPGSTWDHSG